MKRVVLIVLSILASASSLNAKRCAGKAGGKASQNQRVCRNCNGGCSLCYMEDPRAARYRGKYYPRYYQGYPYYGYYQYGSSMGYSYKF